MGITRLARSATAVEVAPGGAAGWLLAKTSYRYGLVINAATTPAATISTVTRTSSWRRSGIATHAITSASAPKPQLVASTSVEVRSCAASSTSIPPMNRYLPILRSRRSRTSSTISGSSAISISIA